MWSSEYTKSCPAGWFFIFGGFKLYFLDNFIFLEAINLHNCQELFTATSAIRDLEKKNANITRDFASAKWSSVYKARLFALFLSPLKPGYNYLSLEIKIMEEIKQLTYN